MSKKVYLTEDKLMLIAEANEEMTFLEFSVAVKHFLRDLLTDPINAEPNEKLVSRGLSKGVMLNCLENQGIIKKKERIDEPYNEEEGKKTSRYYVSYKVPKEDFKKKLRRFYKDIIR